MGHEMDAAAYNAQMEGLAHSAFAEHIGATKAMGAKQRGLDGGTLGWHAGRVCIKRQGTSIFAVELVWLRFGRLLVHGDIAPVIMVAPEASFREAVHRLANSHVDYVAGKVAEGSRQSGGGHSVDPDVFLPDLYQARRDCFADDGHCTVASSVVEAFDTAIENVRHGDGAAHVKVGLYEGGVDPEILHHLGRVVAVPVWYAHAALKRVDELYGWRCPECEGKGWVNIAGPDPDTCPPGPTPSEPCHVCNGTGSVSDRPERRAP